MANYIKPPLLDKTGKEIVAALTGEAVQPSASKINAPISDETGKAILNAIQQGGGGGGASPVIIEVTPTSDTEGTWSGATWEELIKAFNKNVAGARIANTDNIMWIQASFYVFEELAFIAYGYQMQIEIYQNGDVIVGSEQ